MDQSHKVAILIGIAGHQRIPPTAREPIKACVRWVLKSFRQRCPNTPVLLVSSIMGEADELAADVACGEFGAQIIVVSPGSGQVQAPSGRDYTPWVWREVVLANGNHDSAAAGAITGELHGKLAAFVARHSQILLVLRDGESSPGFNVTDQVVRHKLKGWPVEPPGQAHGRTASIGQSPLDRPEGGQIYNILTAKAPTETTPRDIGHEVFDGVYVLYPRGYGSDWPMKMEAFEDRIKGIRLKVDSFNADVAWAESALQAKIVKSKEKLLGSEGTARLADDSRHLVESYARADALAMRFQRNTRWSLALLCVLAGLAALFFSIYAHHLISASGSRAAHHEKIALPIYLGLLGIAGLVFFLVRWLDFQNKHLDYRALAEGLRVQYFWGLVGLGQRVSDYYLRRQRSEMDWIRSAIESCALAVRPRVPADGLAAVHDHWIVPQSQYFLGAAPRREKLTFVASTWGGMGAVFSLALALIVLFSPPHSWIGFGVGALVTSMGAAILWNVLTRHWGRIKEFCIVQGERGRRCNWTTLLPLVLTAYGGGALLHGLIVLAILDWLKALAGPAAASQELEHGLRVVAMGMTAAVGGLIHFYAEKMAWSNEAGQYARMGTIFGDVLNALKSLGVDTGSAPAPGTAAFAAARMVVFELGKEALAESADWAMLHRERPIEIPPPGH